MNLLLHIGAPKSGTSALQKSLALSSEQLTEKGIFFFRPKGPKNQGLSLGLREKEKMTKAAILKYENAETAKEAGTKEWDFLAQEVAHRQPKLTILSEEFFLGVPDKAALHQRLSKIFDKITVVAYVRDPVSRFNSSVNQRIRGGATLKDIVSHKRLIPGIAKQLKEFHDVFGQDAMLVRNFDRANLLDGALEKDFGAIISTLSGETIELESPGFANESIPGAAVAALLFMNEERNLSGDAADRISVRKRRNLLIRMREEETVTALPKLSLTDEKIIAHIRSNFDEEIRGLNQNYLTDQVQIPVAETAGRLKKQELRERLVDWLFGYLDADAAKTLARISLLAKISPETD